jgi:hypothetical protein
VAGKALGQLSLKGELKESLVRIEISGHGLTAVATRKYSIG